MNYDQFQLTNKHIALLRHANVSWDQREFGAATIATDSPYGNSDNFYAGIAEILGIEPHEGTDGEIAFTEAEREEMHRLHKETGTALQVVLATGKFHPAIYQAPLASRDWKLAAFT